MMIYLTLFLSEVFFLLNGGRGADLRPQKTPIEGLFSSNEWPLGGRRNTRDPKETESMGRRRIPSQTETNSIADDQSRDSSNSAIPKSVAWSASGGDSADHVISANSSSSIVCDRTGKSRAADERTRESREFSSTRSRSGAELWKSLKSLRRGSVPTRGAERTEKRGSEETQNESTHAEMLGDAQLWRLQARKSGVKRWESANSFGAGYIERSARDSGRHRDSKDSTRATRKTRFRRQFGDLLSAVGKAASDLSKAAPDLSKVAPDLSKAASDLSKAAPDLSKLAPDLSKAASDLSKAAALPPLPPVPTALAQLAPALQDAAVNTSGTGIGSVASAISNVIAQKANDVVAGIKGGVGPMAGAINSAIANKTKEALKALGFSERVGSGDVTTTAVVNDVTEAETSAATTQEHTTTSASPSPSPSPSAVVTKVTSAAVKEVRAEIIIKNSTMPKRARKKMAKLQIVIVSLMVVLLIVLIVLTVCLAVNKERLVTVKKVEAPKPKEGEKQPLIGSAPPPVPPAPSPVGPAPAPVIAPGAGQEHGRVASASKLVPSPHAPPNMPSPVPAPSPHPHPPGVVGAVPPTVPPPPGPAPGAVPSSAHLPSATVPSTASFVRGPSETPAGSRHRLH